MALKFQSVGDDLRIMFDYTNWKGRHYTYVIDVESIEWARYHPDEARYDVSANYAWTLNGHIVTRDGDLRPELGSSPGNRRRSFLISGLERVEEVNA